MTTVRASATILLSATVVLVLGLYREIRTGRAFTTDVAVRRIFGFFAATFMLLILARPAPKVASGLALVMSAGAVLYDGGAIFSTVSTVASMTPVRRAVFDAASDPDYGIDSLTSDNPGLPPGPDMSVLDSGGLAPGELPDQIRQRQ